MTYKATQTLTDVASFLRLSPFDFSEAVKQRFNTHERPGYETPTPAPTECRLLKGHDSTYSTAVHSSSQWLREYFAPHNIALAAQVGEGCSWTRNSRDSTA